MTPFQYATALSVSSAQQLVATHGAYLAGGIDLLGLMKDYLAKPEILVNIKPLPGLDRIEPGADAWFIGANVTLAQIEDNPDLRRVFPALQAAAAEVGSQQIRNVATLGGNLAQHSRCWYFRHKDIKCLKKGGSICYARGGDNRYHCLFSGQTCISPLASNLAVALAALDATIVVQRGPNLLRWSAADFYARAWQEPARHNSLESGDLILRAEVPNQGRRSAYLQVSEKHEFDWALASCAAAAKVADGKISRARIALGCISPTVHQAQAAHDFLEGKVLDETVAAQAAELVLASARAQTQNAYKIPITHALIRRTLLKLKG